MDQWNGYTLDAVEQRTALSEALLDLSLEEEKDQYAVNIEILSVANPTWTRQRAQVQAVLNARTTSLASAELKCANTRRTYYLSELALSSYNATDFEF